MTAFRKGLPLVVAATALLVCLAGVRANKDSKDDPITDQDFLVKASSASTGEVKLGELAVKLASDDKVRDFAKKLVNDHKKMNDGLAGMAKSLKIAVVAGLEKDTQAAYDRLAKLKGAEFDREFVKQMIDDHEKAINLFEREAKSGANGDLKSFANDHLSELKDHLKDAHTVWNDIKDKK